MKRLRGLLLSFFAFFLSATVLSTPVFAAPDTTTPTTVTAPADAEDEEAADTETEETAEEAEEPEEIPSCDEQIDRLGWLVCPGTGLLANMIDGAYNLLTYLIQVDPIPSDTESPFHLIWTYCRNLTNIVFIGVLLICILSQITGMGISNMGIKRMLPRLIVIVIMSNLSYILCQIAVDLSNILGTGLSWIFETVQEQAIASGAISLELEEVGAGTLVAYFLGIGGTALAGAHLAIAFAGGFTGLIWFLLPVILAGVIAVVSALLTMAARQGLIYLLVMISPIAIVAYALPNTESWARKWYALFMKMLFFYPMFTVLFSASRLAGLVIISTATGITDKTEQAITIVLGLAVQLIPLFMAIPMMRMSGTFLGKISGIVSNITSPATRTFGGYAVERRKHAIENLRRGNNPMLYAHLARYMQQRKTDRVNEIRELEGINRDTYETRYRQGYYDRNGKITRRGIMHYSITADQVENARIVKEIDTDFDEGFNTSPDKPLSDRLTRHSYTAIANANNKLGTELNRTEVVNARADKVRRDNIENRAIHLRDALTNNSGDSNADSYIQNMVSDSFRATDSKSYMKARNAVLARAITQKRKADAETRSEYLELYDDMPAGNLINEALERSFNEGDYNSLEAAIQIMTKRGDQNLITETIEKMTRESQNNVLTRHLTDANSTRQERNEAMRFQKHLLDSTLPLKKDNVLLAAWAKANMIRRAKHEAGKNVAGFIGLADFLNSAKIGDENENDAKALGAEQIISEYADPSWFITQDRTTFKVYTEFKRDGIIKPETKEIFLEKAIRSGLSSGKMDGELLANAVNAFTGNFNKVYKKNKNTGQYEIIPGAKQADIEFFNREKERTLDWLYKYLDGLTPQMLTGQKSDAVNTFSAILGMFGNNNEGFTDDGYSKELRHRLWPKLAGILKNSGNGSTLRNKMNPTVKKILGIPEEDEMPQFWADHPEINGGHSATEDGDDDE